MLVSATFRPHLKSKVRINTSPRQDPRLLALMRALSQGRAEGPGGPTSRQYDKSVLIYKSRNPSYHESSPQHAYIMLPANPDPNMSVASPILLLNTMPIFFEGGQALNAPSRGVIRILSNLHVARHPRASISCELTSPQRSCITTVSSHTIL